MSEQKKLKDFDPKEFERKYGGDGPVSSYHDNLIPQEPSNWKGRLDYWAKFHANRHRVDPERVRAQYHRCDAIGWVYNTPTWPTTGLDLAFHDLEVKIKALELFEETKDLEKLRDKYISFKILTKLMFEPYCTLAELANLTAEFIAYQRKNRKHIIQTGFPKSIFRQSYWFDWYLNRLYYLKSPINPEHTYDKPGEPSAIYKFNPDLWRGRNTEYFSIWVKDAVEIKRTDQTVTKTIKKPAFHELLLISRIGNGKIVNYDGEIVAEICPYIEAPYFDFVEPDMAVRIEKLRETVFDARLEILSHILTVIQSKKHSVRWEQILEILFQKIGSDDTQFLLHMDRLFMKKIHEAPVGDPYKSISDDNRNAGLSDLIHVVGHFERELTIGSVNKSKKLLDSALQGQDISSYFQVVNLPVQNKVDRALSKYRKLRKSDGEFNIDFQSRVNETLKQKTNILNIEKRQAKPSYFPEPWSYDPDTETYSFKNTELLLTPVCRVLLKSLLENFGKKIRYGDLITILRDEQATYSKRYDEKNLMLQIFRLKERLPSEAGAWIQNIPKVGYIILPPKT